MGLGRLHACLALATLALARSAAAAEGEPVRVEVRAPAECADDARFFAEMQARTSHVRLVGSGEAAGHTLRVRVERRGKGFEGELVVVDATGASTRRALSAESCDVVVSGLAWVAARAIDPDASFAPRRVVDAVAPSPVPSAPLAPLFPCAPVPMLEPPPAVTEVAPAPPPPARWRVTVGANAAVFGAALPGPVLDVAGFAEVARESPSLLSPAFRLSVHHTTDGDATVPTSTASFAWTYARVEACPWRFDLTTGVALRACALADAGWVAANGGGGVGMAAGSQARPWLTAGELARLEWAVAGPLRIEAEGGLTLPLLRTSFAFDATTTIYQPPVVVGFASLGLGVRFP